MAFVFGVERVLAHLCLRNCSIQGTRDPPHMAYRTTLAPARPFLPLSHLKRTLAHVFCSGLWGGGLVPKNMP